MTGHQNQQLSHNLCNKLFENVSKLKYLETSITNRKEVHDESKKGLLICSETGALECVCVREWVSNSNGGMAVKCDFFLWGENKNYTGVWKQSAEENTGAKGWSVWLV